MSNKQIIKALAGQGQWLEAGRLCTQLCEAAPGDEEAWFLLGVIQGQLGDYGAAEQSCRRTIALNPAVPMGHFNLGIALQKQGKLDAAQASLREAVRLNPRYAEAHNELGVTLQLGGKLEEAAVCYQQAVAMRPGYAEAHYNLATVLRDMALIIEAKAHFKEAIRLRPSMVKAHDALGQMLCAAGLFDEALAVYREALSLHGNEPELHFQCGKVLASMGKNEEALRVFQRVLDLCPGNAKAYAGMAKILERKGDFARGYEMLSAFLSSKEIEPEVAIAFAALAKHLGRQAEAAALLEQCLNGQMRVDTRKSMHYALGKLYDEARRFDQAFEQYRRANELECKRYDLQKNAQFFNEIKAVFGRESMAHRPRASNKSKLPVFIVGMPRSGTSLVEQILSSHPDVHGAGELSDIGNLINLLPHTMAAKQPYPYCVDGMGRKQLDALAESHLAKLVGLAGSAKRVTDKMPHNFRHLGLIDALFPGARVIHCTRNPIDTCLSIYSLNLNENHLYATDLAQLGAYYRQYQDLMAHWRQVLRIPMLEMRYEDMVDNPEEMTRKLVDFCELKWDECCLRFHESRRAVATPSYDQVRQPIYRKSVERWRNYERHLGPLLAALGMEQDKIGADA